MNTSALALFQSQTQHQKNQGDTYLKFQLGPQTPAVLAMSRAQEVVVLPAHRLTPMPNMPSYVLGLLNRRSRVLWVVDLARMLGLPPVETSLQQYDIAVVRNDSATLGLMVHAVDGVIRLRSESIRSPFGQVASGLVPYLRGCSLQEEEILLVLDAEAIMQSPLLQGA